jgi:hypothetical protein
MAILKCKRHTSHCYQVCDGQTLSIKSEFGFPSNFCYRRRSMR